MPLDLTSAAHAERADEHLAAGHQLMTIGSDWAQVAFFYSAYHFARAALLSDPIFEDPGRCAAADSDLQLADGQTQRHQARRRKGQPKEWGVNDLVRLLYRDINVQYQSLHAASLDVRYYVGAKMPTSKVAEAADAIADAYAAGRMVAP